MNRAAFFWLILLFAPATWAQTDDCARARESYRQGIQSRDYVKKETLFRQAVRQCPTFAEAHTNLADALEHLGRLAEAAQYYREGARLKPELAVAHFGLGDVLRKQGLYAESVSAYKKGLALRPEDRQAREGLAQAREALPPNHPLQFADAEEIVGHFVWVIRSGSRGGVELPFRNIFFQEESDGIASASQGQLDEIGRALWSLVRHAKLTFRVVVPRSGREEAAHGESLSMRRARSLALSLKNRYALDEDHLKLAVSELPQASGGQGLPKGEQRVFPVIVALDRIPKEAPRLMGPPGTKIPIKIPLEKPQAVTGTPGRSEERGEQP